MYLIMPVSRAGARGRTSMGARNKYQSRENRANVREA